MSIELLLDAVKRRDVNEVLRIADELKRREAIEEKFPELRRQEENEATEESRLNELLHAASNAGSPELVSGLLELGADPNAVKVYGCTPLTLAVSENHEDVVRILLDAGADPNSFEEFYHFHRMDEYNTGPQTALAIALGNGFYETAILLLKKGADPRLPDAFGVTPLMRAARDGAEDMVELLLERGAGIDAVDKSGWTAMMHAAENALEDICRYLLERGSNPNIQGREGSTALMLAIKETSSAFVEMLLEHGADTELKQYDGWTALTMASHYGESEKLRILLLAGASSEPFPKNASRETLDWVLKELTEEVEKLYTPALVALDDERVAEFDTKYGRFIAAQPDLSEWKRLAREASLKMYETDTEPVL